MGIAAVAVVAVSAKFDSVDGLKGGLAKAAGGDAMADAVCDKGCKKANDWAQGKLESMCNKKKDETKKESCIEKIIKMLDQKIGKLPEKCTECLNSLTASTDTAAEENESAADDKAKDGNTPAAATGESSSNMLA